MFKDPTDAGYKKLCNTFRVQENLSKAKIEKFDLIVNKDMEDKDMDKVNMDYEIVDII